MKTPYRFIEQVKSPTLLLSSLAEVIFLDHTKECHLVENGAFQSKTGFGGHWPYVNKIQVGFSLKKEIFKRINCD